MLIRRAVPADAMAVARVHVRSWQAAYRGLLPGEYLDALRPEDRAARYDFGGLDATKPRTAVAEEAGAIVGFATTTPARDADSAGAGELAALYVDPDHQRRGIGQALIADARARMSSVGFSTAILWVLAGNAAAERFYRADGWIADGQRRNDTVWGVEVEEVRYSRLL